MNVFTSRSIGFGIAPAYIDGESVCRMFSHATAGQRLPKRLSTGQDPLFRFHRRLADRRLLEIWQIWTIPYAPLSHPFVKRLIGTIRREYLDRVLFWNPWTSRGSWANSGIITTRIACTARSAVPRQPNILAHHPRLQSRSIAMPGISTVRIHFRLRLPLDCELATHR